MAQKKKHKSEDARITDLENLVMAFQDRFAGIEKQLAQGGRWPGPEPVAFYPVYMPTKGEPVGDDAVVPCLEAISTPIDGMHAYATVAANAACPDPKPADKASAALDARKNLMTFGKTWCDAGDRTCTSNSCVPVLSDIKVTGYKTSSRPKDGKKECIVTASITGTVSCQCE